MSERAEIPGDLRAVAIIHLAMGVGALAEVLVRPYHDYYQINFGVLGIPICIGLLRLSRAWRTCALVLLWMGLVLAPIAFLLGVAGFGVLAIPLAHGSRAWMSVTAVAIFVLLLWEYRVLVRPGVRQLFFPDSTPANKPQQPASAPSGARG